MFASVAEDDVLNITNKLKGKFSVDYDEILDKLVKESIQFIIKPLTFYLSFHYVLDLLKFDEYC
jgi:hypothetical protein